LEGWVVKRNTSTDWYGGTLPLWMGENSSIFAGKFFGAKKLHFGDLFLVTDQSA